METITFNVDLDILQKSDFQEFVNKLEQSQYVTINIDEYNESISITGKETSINTAQIQIQEKIQRMSTNLTMKTNKSLQHRQLNSNNNRSDQMLVQTIELSTARKNFLELFGEKHLGSIRTNPDISNISFKNGKLQLTGNSDTIRNVKLNLEQSLYEQNISIPLNITKHLTRTCYGRLLKEFAKKHRVGTSLEPYHRPGNNKHNNTRNLRNVGRGHFANRGIRGGRRNNATHSRGSNDSQQRGVFRGGYRGQGNFNTDAHQQESGEDNPQRGGFRGGYRGQGNFNTDAHHQESDNDNPQRGGFGGGNRGRGNFSTVAHHQESDNDNPQRGVFRGGNRGRGNFRTVAHHQESSEDNPQRGGFRGGYRGRGNFNTAAHHQESDDDNPQRGGFRGGYRGQGNFNTDAHQQESGEDNPQRGGFRGGYRGQGNFNTDAHHQESSEDNPQRGGFRGGNRGRGNFRTVAHHQESSEDNPQRGGFRGGYRGRGNFNTAAHHQESDDDNPQRGVFRGGYRGRGNFNTAVHHQESDDDNPQRGVFRGGNRGRGNFRTAAHHQESREDNPQRGGFRGGYRGQRGRGNFATTCKQPNDNADSLNLNLNFGDLEEGETQGQSGTVFNPYETKVKGLLDNSDDDDRSSQTSDSDTSLASTFTTNSIMSNSCNILTEITLCSDDILSLHEAIEELQNYSIHSESWALTADEYIFIFKQKHLGKGQTTNTSIKDRCSKITYYLRGLVKALCVHIVVSYRRGMWYATVRGFKSDVYPAMLQIKSHLSNVAKTEVQIPVSKPVARFISKKAWSTINKLEKAQNIKIKLFFPPTCNTGDNNEQDDNEHCLKLVGSISGISMAQSAVQEFLDDLSESEHDIPTTTSHFPKDIANNIQKYLKKIEESDDYEAIGWLNFHRSESRPKISLTVVSTTKDTVNEIIQQCKDIIEGYDEWTPAPNDYQTLVNLFFVKKQPSIEQFQQQWNTQVYFNKENKTINISARSKMVAQEIREALQSLASGRANRTDRISVTIPIDLNVRRFVNQVIQPIFEEAKTKKIFIDTRNRNALILNGRSVDAKSIEQKIQTIVDDIKQKLVSNHLQLSFAESELLRGNSYDILRRIERETNTLIRDVKFTKKQGQTSINNIDDTISTLKYVVNNRDQTIIVKKGDITKIKDVDAIVKFSTTDDDVPSRRIIYVNVPKYVGDHRQDRLLLLFSSILSGLNFAEKEHYTSLALPSSCTEVSDLSLRYCTKTTILAIKQFFADNPTSYLKKIIVIDIDDSVCDSFASEVINDHTTDMIDRQMPPLTAKWCWVDDNKKDVSYNETDARQIEAEFQRYIRTFEQTDLEICVNQPRETNSIYYLIQFYDELGQELANNQNVLNERFECGYQVNKNTYNLRTIIRYPLKQENESKLDDHHHRKPLDTYQPQIEITADDWEVISMANSSIEQAKAEIKKAIQIATITERFSVNLVQDINTHERAIQNLAVQNLIQVNFEKDSKDKLTIVLKGLRQNISQAQLQILSYTNDIRTTTTSHDKDDELSIPKEWIEQEEEECKLVQLSQDDPEFVRIEQRVKETMRGVKIHTIDRIQNLRLWNHYAFQRRTLRRTLTQKSNSEIEMELFHGTRDTAPDEIYNGDCGFDMRFCENGLWGRGSYFAKNASYSCQNYSSKLPGGKRQVFLAYVLVGDACDYGTKNDSALRMPPKKDAKLSNIRYNSVTGETGSSRVYIVYNNHLSYPAFLITFTP